MRYMLTFLCLLLLQAMPATAQLLQQQVYGSAGEERGGYLTPLPGGGYMLLGEQSKAGPRADGRLFVVRLNAVGDTLYTRAQKLPHFTAVQVQTACSNAAGQVLVAVSGGDPTTGGFIDEAMLILLNTQGDTLWTRYTNGPTSDYYSDLVLGNDGNFVLTASLNTFPQWLKINSSGQIVSRTNIVYDATDIGAVANVFQDNSSRGGYWVQNIKGVVGNERKLLHLTESGVVDETKPLYGRASSYLRSIIPLPAQSGYLACQDGRLVRFTAALDTLWVRQLPYTAPNGFRTFGSASLVRALPDGNFVVAGGVFGNGGTRVYLSKVTPAGQVLRDTVLYRAGGNEFVNSLVVEPGTGHYVFSGYATQGPLGRADLFFGRHAAWRTTLSTRSPARPAGALAAWPNPVAAPQEAVRVSSARQVLSGELLLHDALGRTERRWPAGRGVATAGGQALSLAGVYLLTGTGTDGRRYVTRVLRE